jgi:type IV pilus assembly protein PilC
MSKHDAIFPPLFVNMVRSGEETGNIDKSFEQMAIHYEKDAKLRGIVKKAMMYPIIVCCLAVVIVVVLLVWIVPQFTDMFNDMDLVMPAYTMAVVALSDFLVQNWYICFGIVLVLVIAFKMFKSTEKGKHILGHAAITFPLIGKLNTKTACAQFARNLQTMLGAGIKITDALEIVAQTMSNLIYSESVYEIKRQVEMGLPLQRSLEKAGLYPSMVTNMVAIGEEAGSTEEMLGTVADYYEQEVEETTQQVAATIEPLLIIFMAVACLSVIVAVFLPIMSLYGQMDTI